jgi:hypothetical protein
MRAFRAAALAAVLLAAGCSHWDEEAVENAEKVEEQGKKNARAKLDDECTKLAATIDKEPIDLDNNKLEVDKIAGEAQIEGLYEALKPRLEELKKHADEAFQTGGDARAKEAVTQARALAAEGKLKDARRKIDGLPNRLRSSPPWKQCEAELAHLDQLERAEAVWQNDVKKADTFRQRAEIEKVRGLYESFLALAATIPAFQESVHAKDAEKAIADLKPELEKAKAAKAVEDAVKWIPAFTGRKDDLSKWNIARYDAADLNAEKVCVFKYGGGDESQTTMTFGEDDWEEYVVEATIRVVKGPAYICVHGTSDGEGQRGWLDVGQLQPFDGFAPGKWVKARLEVRGGEMSFICDGSSTSVNGKKTKNAKGPFAFAIARGAEIDMKDVWVKVYKPQKAGK